MKYLCLIFSDEKKYDAMPKSEDACASEHLAYDEALRKSGHFLVTEALQYVQAATTAHRRTS
ncbi:MAG: YciI family protein [Gammaproteobacteria bacterium]